MDYTPISAGGYVLFLTALSLITDKLNGFEVSVKTNSLVAEFGHSLEVNCSTTCNNPSITLEYKPGINPNRTKGDKWITDRFPSVQKWDFTVPCTVKCQNSVKEDKRVVPIYNRNLSIVTPPDVLEVNKPYQLECTGLKVYPRNKLVLTWLRGSETVANISTEKPGYPDDGPLKNVLHFTPSISDDGLVYTCLAELNLDPNRTKQIANASVTLQTYSFPEPPRILNRDSVEVNQETTLTCEVSNIYPAEKVRLRWFQDGEEWNSVASRSNPTTLQATATWTPRETGVTELKCMADFEDYPSVSSKNDSIAINVYVFSNPEIQIPITTEGIPVNITCSVFNISGELQLRLKKGSEISVSRSASTGLTIYHTVNPRAELNGQQFTCEAELTLHHRSNTIVKRQSATLDVQYKPQNTTISVNNKTVSGFSVFIRVDDEVTITCDSSGNPQVTLTWERPGQGVAGETDLPGVLHIPQATSEHQGIYKCRARNKLGTDEKQVEIKVEAFPEPPRILNRDPVEVNQETTLSCEVSNIYPAEKVRLRWFQDGEEWNSVASRSNPTTVQTTATWTPRETGLTELNCVADFQDYPSVSSKNDSITIDVYVFSNPEIQIPITTEGIPVNITCSVFNVSGELQLRLKEGSEILVNRSASTGLTIYHTVNPRAELNGQQFTCEAELTLHHHSNTIVKRQSATLDVQYSPRKAQISGKQDWIEGKSQILTCRADANPVPEVRWIKDGKTISSGETLHIHSVQLGDSGQYMCRVRNDIGSTNSSHRAEILYKPQNTTISVNNKTVSGFSVFIRVDDEVTITCDSSGNPQVTLTWERPGQGVAGETDLPGVLHIPQATSEHQGIYKCRARNKLGTDEKQVEIKLEGSPDNVWKVVLVILVLILILLVVLVIVCILRNRAQKTGHYVVQNAAPHNNQETPSGIDQESFPLTEVNSDGVLNNNHS
ncbi:vascular cell adhesion protein 1-like [Mobula hypostoma]|uniref:vascular cell adhesion protein 1-like n=1 Tax=Mobula hypostoma TaxID=723540 RepID=UPI002FC35E49